MEKNPHVLSTVKLAWRRVKDMSWDVSEDYLYAEAYKHPSERSADGNRLVYGPDRQTDAMPMQDVASMERAHTERMQPIYDEVDRLDAERWRTAR